MNKRVLIVKLSFVMYTTLNYVIVVHITVVFPGDVMRDEALTTYTESFEILKFRGVYRSTYGS